MAKREYGIDDHVTTLKSYIYLDEAEISGLYNQLYPNVIEKVTSTGKRSDNSLDGSLGGSVFGVVKADGSYETNIEKNTTSETKETIPIERKANIIVAHVCNNKLRPLESIIDILRDSNSMLRGSIVAGFATFALTYLYDENEKLIDLATCPHNGDVKKYTLILESGCTKNVTDLKLNQKGDYYETSGTKGDKYGIEMHLGGEKMRREIRHLTYLVRNGKAFNFALLGHISHAGDKYYSIKPFAIW
ncbi:MAG: hypothetical protein FWH57_09040 [Oscillospiraceae bacterium]|nr:hypothetical protein [Oscillospiraceae bacterium]